MYGLVNDAIEQLVKDKFGLPAWNTISEAAKASVISNQRERRKGKNPDNPSQDTSTRTSSAAQVFGNFESLQNYDDEITMALVVAAAAALSVTPGDVLKIYGGYLCKCGWGGAVLDFV